MTAGVVLAVARHGTHAFSKPTQDSITLLAGLGVVGDAHQGETVKHRSRVARDPTQPNLRQVHLIHAELHDELRAAGFDIAPGAMGENITTGGIDLLGLAEGTLLRLGASAVVRVTGLRNPCVQLDRFRPGLMAATLGRDTAGALVRKAGVMAVVLAGGEVRPAAARAGGRLTERPGDCHCPPGSLPDVFDLMARPDAHAVWPSGGLRVTWRPCHEGLHAHVCIRFARGFRARRFPSGRLSPWPSPPRSPATSRASSRSTCWRCWRR